MVKAGVCKTPMRRFESARRLLPVAVGGQQSAISKGPLQEHPIATSPDYIGGLAMTGEEGPVGALDAGGDKPRPYC